MGPPDTDPASRNDHAAVVYDLDGTLVDLPVDWTALERQLAGLLREHGVESPGGDAWALLADAESAGVGALAEATISRAERRAAPDATRLELADEVLDAARPVGVCSLNCEAAVRVALRAHGLLEHVDSVVGRDTVAARKPDPRPLLAVLEELGVDPVDALFVGDSRSDEETARRAGTAFRYVTSPWP